MFLSNRLFRVANSSSFRSLSQLADSEAASSSIPKPRPHLDGKPGNAKPPYIVTRNSRGSLPVYSDIRNGGSRYLVLIRNVNGNVNALRDDLTASLFQPGSPEAARLKLSVPRSDTLVLTGGRWKHRIMEWLRLKGF